MRRRRCRRIILLTIISVFLTSTCSATLPADGSSGLSLIGSTPGDAIMKSMLGIDPATSIDFIRWNLRLDQPKRETTGSFSLSVNFGEGQPNTLGFKRGGNRLEDSGTYAIAKTRSGDVYQFTGSRPALRFSLIRLNDDLFHMLSPDDRLMVGNGGWSYTLARKTDQAAPGAGLPSWIGKIPDERAERIVFDGRTPCRDFAREYELGFGPDCLKLKWKLTLFREPASGRPTKYELSRTGNRTAAIEGNWALIKGAGSNPDAVIFMLDPDQPKKSVSFLALNENLLFLLTRDGRLFPGDENFGYTLNRRSK